MRETCIWLTPIARPTSVWVSPSTNLLPASSPPAISKESTAPAPAGVYVPASCAYRLSGSEE